MLSDRDFMLRALRLAAEAAGLASPNPQVGCVLVRDNQVIGEGAHRYEDRDHAEIVALNQARDHGTRGATAYVTLEPCSHHGRTGPCADALVNAGIARVVVATQDPNPQVSGQGLAKLRAAAIEVELGVCEQEARELNDAFARFIQTGRPLVTLKAALSADGMLAPPPHRRLRNQPYWLTGYAARHRVQLLRHASDAVLTGIGTVLADDPLLTDRSGLPRRRPLLRVVLDTHLRTPLSSQLVRSAHRDLLILCGSDAATSSVAALERCGVDVAVLSREGDQLSLQSALARLADRRCISLLLECGSALNGAWLEQKLVDKVILFQSQECLGQDAIPFAEGIHAPSDLETQLSRSKRTVLGADTMVTGYLNDPWRGVDAAIR